MFKRVVSQTALTNDAANSFFGHITADSYNGDNSFLATMRALVAPRIPEGGCISMYHGRSDYHAGVISNVPAKQALDMLCGRAPIEDSNSIYIHNLSNGDEANNVGCLELLKAKFCEQYPGWHHLDRISEFYKKSFRVVCFINTELKSVCLFVDRMNMQKWHYLQLSMLAFLPWYFDTQNGMSAIERTLVESLRSRDSVDYEACIAKIAEGYDFESGRIRQLLKGFETRFEVQECENVKRNISQVDRHIRDLNEQFASYMKQRNEYCIRLLGLEAKIAAGSEESEIMDYFLCNRKLELVTVERQRMKFIVRGTIDFYDEDMASRVINNKSSYVYRYCGSRINNTQMEKLMTAIFLDETLKIQTCALFDFTLGESVNAPEHYRFGQSCANYFPNPHLYYYSCLGNYRGRINDAIQKNNYIAAVELCVASTKSLNFADSTVMDSFMEAFVKGTVNNRCILLPDGRVVNPTDAIKWLEEQENPPAEAENKEEVSERVDAVAADVEAQVIAQGAAEVAEPEEQIPF